MLPATSLTGVISAAAAEGHLFLAALLTDLNKDRGLCGPFGAFLDHENSLQLQWLLIAVVGRTTASRVTVLSVAWRAWCFPLLL